MDQNSYEVIKNAVLKALKDKGDMGAAYEAASVFAIGEKALNEENRRIEQEEQERQNAIEIEPFKQSDISNMAAKHRII